MHSTRINWTEMVQHVHKNQVMMTSDWMPTIKRLRMHPFWTSLNEHASFYWTHTHFGTLHAFTDLTQRLMNEMKWIKHFIMYTIHTEMQWSFVMHKNMQMFKLKLKEAYLNMNASCFVVFSSCKNLIQNRQPLYPQVHGIVCKSIRFQYRNSLISFMQKEKKKEINSIHLDRIIYSFFIYFYFVLLLFVFKGNKTNEYLINKNMFFFFV